MNNDSSVGLVEPIVGRARALAYKVFVGFHRTGSVNFRQQPYLADIFELYSHLKSNNLDVQFLEDYISDQWQDLKVGPQHSIIQLMRDWELLDKLSHSAGQ